jgi:hypothetical protein
MINYRETLWSEIYPGSRNTVQCLEPAILATEALLAQTVEQRKRTVWRLDGGSGNDESLRWILERDYQLVAKGCNNRRAVHLAQQVSRWDPYRDGFLAEVLYPTDLGRPVRCFIKRWVKDGEVHYSYYIFHLSTDTKFRCMELYDARGAAEVEQFRSDKSGLSLDARRKHSFMGQTGYVLLNDLAHNLLSDLYFRALAGTAFGGFGLKRIVRDLLACPGLLIFQNDRLVQVDLLSRRQFAPDLANCLQKLCEDY